jgi:hypothetical protein
MDSQKNTESKTDLLQVIATYNQVPSTYCLFTTFRNSSMSSNENTFHVKWKISK